MDEQIEWHRPEFQGRESELSSVTELAQRAGVEPNTVSSWIRRHPSFPEIVMTKRGAVTTKYFATAEFDTYRQIQEEVARQARAKKSAPPRSPAIIARERLDALAELDDKLAAEEQDLAAKLAAVLQRRHKIDEERGELRRRLEKDLAAIQEALGTEQP